MKLKTLSKIKGIETKLLNKIKKELGHKYVEVFEKQIENYPMSSTIIAEAKIELLKHVFELEPKKQIKTKKWKTQKKQIGKK